MTLRPFVIEDAATILSWCKDKPAFRRWSADRYQHYPALPEDMMHRYEGDNMYPLTAIAESKVVGHILLRYPSADKTLIRFGFVIVDDTIRGKGYGKQMLQLAIEKAKNEFGAKMITLGVFDNNLSAFHCYESVGFKVTGTDSYLIDGEEWTGKEMEIKIEKMKIEIATIQDVPALLDLQRKAFGPLCEELGWKDALPLTESLEHAYEEFTKCTTLKVQNDEGLIIGSVNGNVTDESLYIGRLMVLPEYQQQGIGKLLFREIQSRLPHNRAWLCTCQQVRPTYEFYLREGFKPYKSEEIGPGLTWAYLEKLIGEHK